MRLLRPFALLRQRRFAPLFWVQFLGAANDNVFKFAFTLLATYAATKWGGVDSRYAGFLIGALFVVGEPVPPAIATPELLMQRVQELRGAQK